MLGQERLCMGRVPLSCKKTNEVHAALHTWDKEELKAPARKLKKLKRELERRRRGPMMDENLAEQKELLLRI